MLPTRICLSVLSAVTTWPCRRQLDDGAAAASPGFEGGRRLLGRSTGRRSEEGRKGDVIRSGRAPPRQDTDVLHRQTSFFFVSG